MQAHKLELQQQIAEKQAVADGLQAEHACLAARNSMLEKVLDTQQAAVGILQGRGQVTWHPLCPLSLRNHHDLHSTYYIVHHTTDGCWCSPTKKANTSSSS